jgi:uncharacterized RDD family membrane protein YckC
MNEAADDREELVHSFLSPEAVRLDLPISGPVPRMLAYGIDLMIMIVLTVFLFVILMASSTIGAAFTHWVKASVREALQQSKVAIKQHPSENPVGGLAVAITLLVEFTISTCYFIFWEMVTGGRSPGKMLVGLRVVRRNGLPIDLRSSVVRNLMRAVDILPAEYLVGLIAILLSSSGERLGDHVAGTVVLRLDKPETAAEIPRTQSQSKLVLTRAQLGLIGPREIKLIRSVLRRSSTVSDSRSDKLIADAAEAMRLRLGLAEIPNVDQIVFLQDLLAAAERAAGDG